METDAMGRSADNYFGIKTGMIRVIKEKEGYRHCQHKTKKVSRKRKKENNFQEFLMQNKPDVNSDLNCTRTCIHGADQWKIWNCKYVTISASKQYFNAQFPILFTFTELLYQLESSSELQHVKSNKFLYYEIKFYQKQLRLEQAFLNMNH